MSDAQLPRAALISSDSTFVAQVKQLLTGPTDRSRWTWSSPCRSTNSVSSRFRHCVALAPELIILDLEESQDLGLQLAQYLVELNPAQLFIATGPVLSSEQLMQAMRAGVSDYLPKPVATEGSPSSGQLAARTRSESLVTRSRPSRAAFYRSSAPRAEAAPPLWRPIWPS